VGEEGRNGIPIPLVVGLSAKKVLRGGGRVRSTPGNGIWVSLFSFSPPPALSLCDLSLLWTQCIAVESYDRSSLGTSS
jgi:hypothetical protein